MKLNSFELKIFAMILMILDHIHTYIPNMPIWFAFVGRIVSPIFFFLMVEGFFHTKNRKKYAVRLFTWSLIMFVGSNLVVMLFNREIGLRNNIFLSMAIAVLLMSTIEYSKKNKENKKLSLLYIILAIGIAFLSIFTEASIFGLSMTLIFYFFRNKQTQMLIVYIITSLFLTVGLALTSGLTIKESLLYDPQWFMIFAAPFLIMYNGERGLNTKFTKYMFYFFYPIHLWVIYIIGYYLG